MKRTKLQRLLALVTAVVMLAGMLPALSLTAGARAPLTRIIATADELRQYLQDSGDYDLILSKDIDKYVSSAEVWCTVHGNKRLDMHGYDFTLHQDEGEETSVLFNVAEDANLTVYDSQNSEAQSTIEYRAYIHGGTLGMLTYYRHLFEVDGKLTLNNVRCVAGRAKTEYNTWYAKTVHKQTYGSAVIVNTDGYLEVNGAYLSGHTHPKHLLQTPVIDVKRESTVVFNVGEVHGLGGANCFNVGNKAELRVASGIFDSDYYRYVQWGMPEDAAKVSSPGIVGLASEDLAPDALTYYEGNNLVGTSDLIVYAPSLPLEVEGVSGDTQTTGGSTLFRLLDSSPILRIKPFHGYYKTDVDDSPRAEHRFTTMWELYDGSTMVASSAEYNGIVNLKVMEEFSHTYTVTKDKPYRVRCRVCEIVGPGSAEARCYRYTGDYNFLVTDTLEAPTIQKGPTRSLIYTSGGSVSISVEADGDGLRYQWYRSHAGGRPSAVTGRTATSSTLNLYDLTAEYDGDYFFCIVSNSQGKVQSSSCKLVLNKPITEIPLLVEQPMHGVPLDSYVEMDVPGLKITNVRWAYRTLKSTYETLSETRCSNPIAGQRIYLCVSIMNDGSANVESGVKVTALGVESTSVEYLSAYEAEFRIPLTVEAEGNVKIDTVTLSFDSDGAPEVGQQVGSVLKRSCGYRAWAPGIHDADIRYSIEEIEWLDGGLSVEKPEIQKNHTYTLKVRLAASDDWIFSKNTVVLLEGEEIDYQVVNEHALYWITFEKTYAMMENPFEDVNETDYFFAPVLWAYNHAPQVTTGASATRFSPGKTCTRAQVVTFLWRANGCPKPKTASNPFTDVPAGQYYYDAVLWAVENGITNGVDATHFGPDRGCTRAQVVTFLWRTFGEPEPLNDDNPFIDVPASQYYYKAVLWAVGNRITTGTSTNKFSPDATCTRGQIVTFLYRAIAQANALQKDDFFMYVEEVFSIPGRGVILTGRVANGVLHPDDELVVYTRTEEGEKIETSCTSIEINKKLVEEAKAGDNIGLLVRGGSVSMYHTGDAVAGANVPVRVSSQCIVGTLRLLTKEEGGRHTPIGDGYRPQVYVGVGDVSATVANLPDGTLSPGETAYNVELQDFALPVVVYPGQKLALREGGRTSGEFIVGELRN